MSHTLSNLASGLMGRPRPHPRPRAVTGDAAAPIVRPTSEAPGLAHDRQVRLSQTVGHPARA